MSTETHSNRVVLLWGIFGALCCDAGSSGDVERNQSKLSPTPMAQGLTVSQATAYQLAGSYAEDTVGLSYSVITGGNSSRLVLFNRAGTQLLRIEKVAGTYTLALGQDEFVVTVPVRDVDDNVNKLKSGDRDALKALADISSTKGDQKRLGALMLAPEFRLLPNLSRALGEGKGLTALDYPSVAPLHNVAMTVSRMLDLPAPKAPPKTEQPLCDQPDWWNASCSLTTDPGNNGCYGMCGSGCCCWHWVCGDCCYHWGCYLHDYFCRNCHWYRPDNCFNCYMDIVVFFTVFAVGCY